jgi:homoserine O-acetyltransferase
MPCDFPQVDAVVRLADVPLECGETLAHVDVRYHLDGMLAPARDNVVLIAHALTGTTRAADWWPGVVGAGAAFDPTRHAVLSANLLGGCDGTTGPSVQHPAALPPITPRDQALVLARLLDALEIRAPLLVCGGSLGGMVTLEFAASFPSRFGHAVALAAPAVQTAQGIAWNALMRQALSLGGPSDGFALARMIGMISYRTPEGLEARFANDMAADGTPEVTSWMEAHGRKLVARFDPVSYRALIDAMDRHDVGRGRGGVAAALAPVAGRLTGVGIPGDLLYPESAVRAWTEASGASLALLDSPHGHDAFLLERAQVGALLRHALRGG